MGKKNEINATLNSVGVWIEVWVELGKNEMKWVEKLLLECCTGYLWYNWQALFYILLSLFRVFLYKEKIRKCVEHHCYFVYIYTQRPCEKFNVVSVGEGRAMHILCYLMLGNFSFLLLLHIFYFFIIFFMILYCQAKHQLQVWRMLKYQKAKNSWASFLLVLIKNRV